MRLLVTGRTEVLGRALRPLPEAAGHEFAMPRREELDLFDASAVADAVRDVDGVLRLGLLDGPGTWYDQPMGDFGATLHVSDAGLALLSALSLPSGIYNVCRDGERVSTERFTRAAGWHPQR